MAPSKPAGNKKRDSSKQSTSTKSNRVSKAIEPPATTRETRASKASKSKPESEQPSEAGRAREVQEKSESTENGRSYWLMKAEPDSRLEKGVDVKFSIDDLAARSEPEPWDGELQKPARRP